MPLTAMTYNIRNGGEPDRLDRIVRVVSAHHPDLLALQELRGFDHGRLREVAGALGMRPFLGRSWFGQPVAILVREPARVLASRRIRRPFHHGAVEVIVATDGGALTAISTHLDPYSGGRRRWEAGWLAARVRRDVRRDGLALVMGDLNTLDPWTDHTERLGALAPEFRGRHLRRGTVDSRAVAVLAEAGLVDLYRHAGDPAGPDYTAPTRYGGGTEFSHMRLDYILGTPAVARVTRGCRIVSGGDAESASDHYPVLADLALTLE
jgi:endonuclease/exonuclease/phosphatase family metal-dependent hydrolase